MNETLHLDVVELGDAKDLTKGVPNPLAVEDNGPFPERCVS